MLFQAFFFYYSKNKVGPEHKKSLVSENRKIGLDGKCFFRIGEFLGWVGRILFGSSQVNNAIYWKERYALLYDKKVAYSGTL